MAAIACVFAFNGCKKDDKIGTTQNEDLPRIREQINKLPFTNTNVVNVKTPGYYGDADGNPIVRMKANNGNSGMSTLGGGCPAPEDDYPEQTIYSVKTGLVCGQGYMVEVTYDLTLVYEPLLTNAAGAASFGRIRLKNAAGTVIWPTTTPVPKYNVVSIVNMGSTKTDPSGLPLTTYRVTFKTDYIAENIFANAASVETYLFAYTDCPNIPTFVCPYSQQQTSTNFLGTISSPCSRTDRIYFNATNGEYKANVAGAAVRTSCIPYGYVFPNKQQIEFKNKDGVWVSFVLNGGYVDGDKTGIRPMDICYFNIQASVVKGLITGNVQVRYYNVMDSGCQSDYVYETWYIE